MPSACMGLWLMQTWVELGFANGAVVPSEQIRIKLGNIDLVWIKTLEED